MEIIAKINAFLEYLRNLFFTKNDFEKILDNEEDAIEYEYTPNELNTVV